MLRRWQARSCEWVFAGATKGRPLAEGTIYNALPRAAKRAKVAYGQKEGFMFHDTRRTAITEMLEAGIPFPAIQSRTGQTRKRVLQYAQPMRSSRLRSAEVLEERFGQGNDTNSTVDSERARKS